MTKIKDILDPDKEVSVDMSAIVKLEKEPEGSQTSGEMCTCEC